MTEHHYSKQGVVADYVRAGIGATLAGGPLFYVETGPVIRVILVLAVMLFMVYGIIAWHRQLTTIYAGEESVLAKGLLTKKIVWSELRELKLNYYSTKRDRKEGWMQLSLKGAGTQLKILSTLSGFEEIVAQAAREAKRRGVQLSPTTLENLRLLGVKTDAGGSQEEIA